MSPVYSRVLLGVVSQNVHCFCNTGCVCVLIRLPSAACRWSLDLGVSTDIVGLVIAMQTGVGDLKIAIGDNESPLSNAECSVGVQIEANATSAQVCQRASSFKNEQHNLVHCLCDRWKLKPDCVQCLVAQVCNGKGRYLTLSRLSGAAVSLCGVEVFPVAANAASSKQASGSGGSGAFLVTDGADTVSRALSQTAYGVVSRSPAAIRLSLVLDTSKVKFAGLLGRVCQERCDRALGHH